MVLPVTNASNSYGPRAGELLHPLKDEFTGLAEQVADKFYDSLLGRENTAVLLNRLRPEEFKQLKQHQAAHIVKLLSPDLTHETHVSKAQHTGLVHALVGVQIPWLIEAYNRYQDTIYEFLRAYIPKIDVREQLIQIINQRILLDMEAQVSSYQRVNQEVTAAFVNLDQLMVSTSNLNDLIRGTLNILGKLSGEISVFFARVDEQGEIQIEQSYGAAADKYHQAMEAGEVPRISIDPNLVSGRGPGGRAWRSGEIVYSDAWLIESDKAPWQKIGEVLGFRSSAAVPLLDESGRSIALLSLYSAWPGFFSTDRVRGFFSHVQHILSHALQQQTISPVVPLREQQSYRRTLSEGQIIFFYQPIISLSDGSLKKIEALARMKTANGEIISPQRFLPAFGRDELLNMFTQGLKTASADILLLNENQIDSKLSINFPAEGFDDPRYGEVLFQVFDSTELAADRLQLEVLETQDSGEMTESRKAFIQRLRDVGVEIAEDDLGSGHSSLLRLEQYSFDEVKIDQGLVRGVLHNPKRIVEFILYLTRLAHAFDIPVTVEGLENVGMIEAAAILGADHGQGYGIARPMPIGEVPAWYRNYRFSVNPAKPKTAIGAMAGYLLWDMQLAVIAEQPEVVTEFVGAKAIVEEFITANGLQGGRIDELLRRNHELAASSRVQREDARYVRAQLIEELTKHWLAAI